MTLLKNNGILPLDKRNIKKIAVIGPNADSEPPCRVITAERHQNIILF